MVTSSETGRSRAPTTGRSTTRDEHSDVADGDDAGAGMPPDPRARRRVEGPGATGRGRSHVVDCVLRRCGPARAGPLLYHQHPPQPLQPRLRIERAPPGFAFGGLPSEEIAAFHHQRITFKLAERVIRHEASVAEVRRLLRGALRRWAATWLLLDAALSGASWRRRERAPSGCTNDPSEEDPTTWEALQRDLAD